MTPTRALGLPEFVAMIAVIFSSMALATDAMLPALPTIGAELSPDAPQRASMVVGFFMAGMGFGTFFSGPLADAYGRKSITLIGVAIFLVGSIMAYYAPTFEIMLLSRVIQGIGAAGPRIAPLAMVRDLFEGRRMAQILSFVTTMFMIVPAVAPSLGALVQNLAGWRAIFMMLAAFSLFGGVWLLIRQPETLAVDKRIPIKFSTLKASATEVLTNRLVMRYIFVFSLGFFLLVSLLSSTQAIYSQTYGREESFPLWFASTAMISALAIIINARLVITYGMRLFIKLAFAAQAVFASLALIIIATGTATDLHFIVWFLWSTSIVVTISFSFGNLNALIMRPMGHIAGMAATVASSVATVLGVLTATPASQLFDGTPVPLITTCLIAAAIAWWLMYSAPPLPGDATIDDM